MTSIISIATRLWTRMYRFLNEHNDRHVAAWGASLQYKRRYTNPDDAKRSRRMQ